MTFYRCVSITEPGELQSDARPQAPLRSYQVDRHALAGTADADDSHSSDESSLVDDDHSWHRDQPVVPVAGDRPVIKMEQTVYLKLMRELGGRPFEHERAGILFGPHDRDDVVTDFVPDRTGSFSATSFTLDHVTLNQTIRRNSDAGISCNGIVHSHPPGIAVPSGGDVAYLRSLFSTRMNAETTRFLFPIVCNGRLYPYVVDGRDVCRILTAELVLI